MTGNIELLDPETRYVDPPETIKPFAPYYDQHILPLVKEFEVNRIETLDKIRIRSFKMGPFLLILAVISAIGIFSYTEAGLFDKLQNWAMICIAGLVCAVVWIAYPAKQYNAQVKERIFPLIFNFISPDCVYQAKSPLSAKELKKFRIIPRFDEEVSDDYIKTNYKNVTIELYETRLNQVNSGSDDDSTHIIFKGIFVILSMNKNFKGSTIVLKDAGSIVNWLKNVATDLKNVKLEDPKFEKEFEVYSSDQVEARYLLTTSFMERLLKLKSEFGGYGIKASFFQNQLLLMIEYHQDLFQVASIMKPATFIEDIQTILRQTEQIFLIVEILKLEEKTGL